MIVKWSSDLVALRVREVTLAQGLRPAAGSFRAVAVWMHWSAAVASRPMEVPAANRAWAVRAAAGQQVAVVRKAVQRVPWATPVLLRARSRRVMSRATHPAT